ncbi:MAG: CoA transferase [SAR116 cluster bacterium]|nr:MAG: CoA transferase [SAR116 cluster bacterium]|tara:strand:- start:302 stop:1423 length:1122 start_codon:yes stop_codon:yes gene_type:complete
MGLDTELSGILVVSLEQAVAAPYCGLLMANAGARVIKVERPEGDFARGYDSGADGQSAIFAWLNRGKESVCLNLKADEDKALLCRMLGKADVLVSNLAPGALGRMGLVGADLRQQNPGLITCAVTGYGETGEAATKKAYDFLVQGESGICSVTGTEDSPSRVGVSITDISTGMTAFSAILRALIQRGRTGEGIDISISMFDVMADWMNMPLMAHRYSGGAPKRMGLKHTFVAPYGAFACGDGGQVLLSVQSNREFRSFCAIVLTDTALADDPRFVDNPDRFANRDTLNGMIDNVFGELTAEQVLNRLDDANIANARLNSVADLSEHKFLRNQKALIGESQISMAALPVQTKGEAPYRVPDIGQHSAAIRKEFS